MAKEKSKAPGKRRVTFLLESPEADAVFLVGDFNDWNPDSHPMKKDGNGTWKKTVMLSPETYEYRFWVDGEWKNDPNGEACPNCFGSQNNYIVVAS